MADLARVTFRKQVSDGNYGSETAEVTLDLPEFAVGQTEYVGGLLAEARRLVHMELSRSPSWSVQRALEYPKPVEARADESAELELAIGKREAYADLEDLPFGDED